MTNSKTAETVERTLTSQTKLYYDVIAATSRPRLCLSLCTVMARANGTRCAKQR